MNIKTIIFAISEYYGISALEAKDRYYNRVEKDEYDQCVEWYLDKKDDCYEVMA